MINLELTVEEYDMLVNIISRHRNKIKKKDSKWIRVDHYMVNRYTGRKFDVITNEFVN